MRCWGKKNFPCTAYTEHIYKSHLNSKCAATADANECWSQNSTALTSKNSRMRRQFYSLIYLSVFYSFASESLRDGRRKISLSFFSRHFLHRLIFNIIHLSQKFTSLCFTRLSLAYGVLSFTMAIFRSIQATNYIYMCLCDVCWSMGSLLLFFFFHFSSPLALFLLYFSFIFFFFCQFYLRRFRSFTPHY